MQALRPISRALARSVLRIARQYRDSVVPGARRYLSLRNLMSASRPTEPQLPQIPHTFVAVFVGQREAVLNPRKKRRTTKYHYVAYLKIPAPLVPIAPRVVKAMTSNGKLTQIRLTEERHRFFKAWCAKRGITMTDAITRYIDALKRRDARNEEVGEQL